MKGNMMVNQWIEWGIIRQNHIFFPITQQVSIFGGFEKGVDLCSSVQISSR